MTSVVADEVMAQVEIVCGQQRVVSVMSAEAVPDLGLHPGMLAAALIKATDVIVKTPTPCQRVQPGRGAGVQTASITS